MMDFHKLPKNYHPTDDPSTSMTNSKKDWTLSCNSTGSDTSTKKDVKVSKISNENLSSIPVTVHYNQVKTVDKEFNDCFVSKRWKNNDDSRKESVDRENSSSYDESSVFLKSASSRKEVISNKEKMDMNYNQNINETYSCHLFKADLDEGHNIASCCEEKNCKKEPFLFELKENTANHKGSLSNSTAIRDLIFFPQEKSPHSTEMGCNSSKDSSFGENASLSKLEESRLLFSSSDSSIFKNGRSTSQVMLSNTHDADCNDSDSFRSLESSILSNKEENHSEETICDNISDSFTTENLWRDVNVDSSTPITDNVSSLLFLKDNHSKDTNPTNSQLEVIDKQLVKSMKFFGFDCRETATATMDGAEKSSIDNSLNFVSHADEAHKRVANFRNGSRNAFDALSPITEGSNISNTSTTASALLPRTETSLGFTTETLDLVGDSCTIPSPVRTSNNFDGMLNEFVFEKNGSTTKKEKTERDIKRIMNSLINETEARKTEFAFSEPIMPDFVSIFSGVNSGDNNSLQNTECFLSTTNKANPVSEALNNVHDASNFQDINSIKIDAKREDKKLFDGNFKNMSNLEINLSDIKKENLNLTSDEILMIPNMDIKLDSTVKCSPMDASDAEPSCSYMNISDSSNSFLENHPLKQLFDINKTVADAVLKSILKLGNNKVTVPQILKYIARNKIIRAYSKLEQDVRKFLKAATDINIVKNINNRYTLFGQNNIPSTTALKLSKKKDSQSKIKTGDKILKSSRQPNMILTRNKAKLTGVRPITPKDMTLRRLPSRTMNIRARSRNINIMM